MAITAPVSGGVTAPIAPVAPVAAPTRAVVARSETPARDSHVQEPAAQSLALATSASSSPQVTIAHLQSLKAKALDPAHPDPALAAAITRALQAEETKLREQEAEARRQLEAQERRAADARKEQGSQPLELPSEAFRPLTPAQRLTRASVEGAYLAGDLAPGGLNFQTTA